MTPHMRRYVAVWAVGQLVMLLGCRAGIESGPLGGEGPPVVEPDNGDDGANPNAGENAPPDTAETPEPTTDEPRDEPSDGSPSDPEPAANAMPDFSIIDVNANSTRAGESISPREYLGQVSAWYFGHST